ncbi:MAG TPA: cysteine hydrolase [Actinophytocola sp.]|jgi:nicotinamidase-related amidase|nr:cysteine hydrolase [Actinophytocola sp.]
MTLDPHATALLVMDYQAGVVANVADGEALVARTAGAIATVREHGGHVGYVRVAFTEADYANVPASNVLFARLLESRRMDDGDPGTAVPAELAPGPDDIVVRKVRVGAFSTTDLDARLRERGVTTLVLAGIATSGVVLSTLRDAADRDYRLFVLEDCCADRDPEVHDVLLHKVFPRQAEIITAAELPGLLSGAPRTTS